MKSLKKYETKILPYDEAVRRVYSHPKQFSASLNFFPGLCSSTCASRVHRDNVRQGAGWVNILVIVQSNTVIHFTGNDVYQ